MENQHLFAFDGKRSWRDVPEHFLANTVAPFEPYAPKISKLSKAKFGVGDE
ncbi:hypothetical protein N4R57_16410 [Rhodobacteraceae bacterium D3-12]|nr:hypothetical protein N4R57_16410 [Rhodobacteraceae bacterium D3-12]